MGKEKDSFGNSDFATLKRKKFFPFKMSSGVICESVPREEFKKTVEKHFLAVFGKSYAPLEVRMSAAERKGITTIKNEYLKIHCEDFLFKKDGKVIGWFMGEMDDFETFYMRNTGILPKYQGQGLYTEFLTHLLNYLKTLGYQRVSSHHAPDNVRIFNLKMKQGFMIVGSENHERYGQLVKMVKIFNKEREQIYKTKFKG